MRSGITRQALRRHRWSLLGPACTQLVAACVISMMVMTAAALKPSRLTRADHDAVVAADLPETTSVFIGISIYLSILIVGVTMSLAIAQQLRDITLLRAVGASPGQVRRSVALQAALIAVPASLLGYLLAIPAGYAWVAMLTAKDVLPAGVHFGPQLTALPIALGIELATSVVGASIAAIRVSRMAPSAAMAETSSGRPHISRVRVTAGLSLLVGGVVLAGVLSSFDPQQASDAAFFVMLAECVGVGLLGPVILRTVARVLRLLLTTGLPRLAVDNIAARSRAWSGALVPLVLAIAFATVKVGTHTTSAHVIGKSDPAPDLWTDYSGTAVYCAFAAIAALNTLITVLVGRGRDLAVMQLVGGTRRTVIRMVIVEGALVAGTALVLAAVVASATLIPVLRTGLGTWIPYIPVGVVAAGVVLVGAVVAAGMVAPAAVLTKRPPVEAAET